MYQKYKLELRALLFAKIRQFFKQQNVLEVETPLLYPAAIPSPHIQSFSVQFQKPQQKNTQIPGALYLQTSPEFAMKRLLAEGCGDIFQLCKAFRDGEHGKLHNPEFTILEWYRIGYDHHKLMDDVEKFIKFILNTHKTKRLTYAEVFEKHLHLNPHQASVTQLKQCAKQNGIDVNWVKNQDTASKDKNVWLQLLLTHLIEPHLGQDCPTFIYDFPEKEAALAKIRIENIGGIKTKIAERFELYIKGIELANGFNELTNTDEQRQRFVEELEERRALCLPCPPIDEKFLKALNSLPPCAGVALGVDRLLMLLANKNSIAEVMSFDVTTV